MNKQKTFFAFLESLKSENNKSIIESIKAGYSLLEDMSRNIRNHDDDGFEEGGYNDEMQSEEWVNPHSHRSGLGLDDPDELTAVNLDDEDGYEEPEENTKLNDVMGKLKSIIKGYIENGDFYRYGKGTEGFIRLIQSDDENDIYLNALEDINCYSDKVVKPITYKNGGDIDLMTDIVNNIDIDLLSFIPNEKLSPKLKQGVINSFNYYVKSMLREMYR